MDYLRLFDLSNSYSLKYLRSFGCKDIGIRKSEFVAKNSVPLNWILISKLRI